MFLRLRLVVGQASASGYVRFPHPHHQSAFWSLLKSLWPRCLSSPKLCLGHLSCRLYLPPPPEQAQWVIAQAVGGAEVYRGDVMASPGGTSLHCWKKKQKNPMEASPLGMVSSLGVVGLFSLSCESPSYLGMFM